MNKKYNVYLCCILSFLLLIHTTTTSAFVFNDSNMLQAVVNLFVTSAKRIQKIAIRSVKLVKQQAMIRRVGRIERLDFVQIAERYGATSADMRYLSRGRYYATERKKFVHVKDELIHCSLENKSRMAEGKPPIGRDGKSLQLHHVGCQLDSPLTVMNTTEHQHRSSQYHNRCSAGVHNEENNNLWNKERREVWLFFAKKMCR